MAILFDGDEATLWEGFVQIVELSMHLHVHMLMSIGRTATSQFEDELNTT